MTVLTLVWTLKTYIVIFGLLTHTFRICSCFLAISTSYWLLWHFLSLLYHFKCDYNIFCLLTYSLFLGQNDIIFRPSNSTDLSILLQNFSHCLVCLASLFLQSNEGSRAEIVLWFPDRTSVCIHPWHQNNLYVFMVLLNLINLNIWATAADTIFIY